MSKNTMARKRRPGHRARRRRRRRRPAASNEDIIAHILAHLQTVRRPGPPIDPYGRGGVVPPMRTAQKMSFDLYGRTRDALQHDTGGTLWGVPPYRGPGGGALAPAGGGGVAVGAGGAAHA